MPSSVIGNDLPLSTKFLLWPPNFCQCFASFIMPLWMMSISAFYSDSFLDFYFLL